MAKTAQIPTRLINLLAISAVIFSSLLAVLFAGQLPLDYHSFRQTQTALTAYWFIREGYKLVYETPVAGYPWQIPFEFPIYQYVVAAISQTLGLPVTAVGRLVSFGFLLLCLPVVWAINRRLSLPPIVVAFFAAVAAQQGLLRPQDSQAVDCRLSSLGGRPFRSNPPITICEYD